MKRLLLLVCLLVPSGSAQQPSAISISLGLFTTRTIHSLTATPLETNAWVQTCASCRHSALRIPLHLDHVDHTVYLGGQLRIQSEGDGPVIEAAGLYTIVPT